jgi:hypothetical protein
MRSLFQSLEFLNPFYATDEINRPETKTSFPNKLSCLTSFMNKNFLLSLSLSRQLRSSIYTFKAMKNVSLHGSVQIHPHIILMCTKISYGCTEEHGDSVCHTAVGKMECDLSTVHAESWLWETNAVATGTAA